MPHLNPHSCQIIPSKNVAKGTPNFCGEEIAVFHFPSESCPTQKAKPFDQTSKEVPRGEMVRLVEAIAQRI